MKLKYLNFIRGVSINNVSRYGVTLSMLSFLLYILYEFFAITGILTSKLVGLIAYLLLPTLFVVGIVLIIYGWARERKVTGKSFRELLESQYSEDELEESETGTPVFRAVLITGLIGVLFLIVAGLRTLHFMDEPEFCGTACHSVMNPEWTVYQASPHSHVACVECHVGEGTKALIDSKINGAWQMISITFDLYERPIPTPVHQLRPARETCEKCHWPDKFYGTLLKTFVHYKPDKNSTPSYTTLALKVDTRESGNKSGIHWHIGKNNEVRYSSVNDEREEILWVESKQPDGTYKRYVNKKLKDLENSGENATRVMDCVDCHNRVTHIYQDPEEAVDKSIHKGLIPRSIPFIKRESLGALTASFTDAEKGKEIVKNRILGFYRQNLPEVLTSRSRELDKAIETLQNIYATNIHHRMNIDWNPYPNHLGHKHNGGCFRCHNENMVDASGKAIRYDCTLCHSILAYDSDKPFKYLEPVKSAEKDSAMHADLQSEFLNSYK